MPKIILKPCPMCGSDDIKMLPQHYGYSVHCQTCGLMKRSATRYRTQAACSWNKRYNPVTKLIED